MNKKIVLIVSIAAALILIGGGYYYFKTRTQTTPEVQKSAAEQAAEDIQKTAASVSAGVGSSVSPNVVTPDANPYNKTNPFSGLKTNPFQ